jgi:hypothetical protein
MRQGHMSVVERSREEVGGVTWIGLLRASSLFASRHARHLTLTQPGFLPERYGLRLPD